MSPFNSLANLTSTEVLFGPGATSVKKCVLTRSSGSLVRHVRPNECVFIRSSDNSVPIQTKDARGYGIHCLVLPRFEAGQAIVGKKTFLVGTFRPIRAEVSVFVCILKLCVHALNEVRNRLLRGQVDLLLERIEPVLDLLLILSNAREGTLRIPKSGFRERVPVSGPFRRKEGV